MRTMLPIAARPLLGLAALISCRADAHRSARADTTPVTAAQVVSALEAAYGVHPGQRRNHTKGFCALGTFVGARGATRYSRSVLFTGDTIPVVARFSIAGGNPAVADADRSARGMALELRPRDGSRMHMTMIDTPMFFARTPRTFLDRMRALAPDRATHEPDPVAVALFEETHPDAAAQTRFLADHNPPPSHANRSYFGIHAFRFVNRDQDTTLVRWRFVPQDGEKSLTDAELRTMPHDFLERAMVRRMTHGPVRWEMWLTIGARGDREDDPTTRWPPDRAQLRAGTLSLTSAMPQAGAPCERINYDPLVLTDGIAPSSDPVLRFRSPSNSASFAKRSVGK